MPDLVKPTPQRVEFSVNDLLSNSGHTNCMLQFLYAKYLKFYLYRYTKNKFGFPVTLLHIVYWRSQLKFLGSDLIRRDMLTREQLNTDIRSAVYMDGLLCLVGG